MARIPNVRGTAINLAKTYLRPSGFHAFLAL